VAVLCRDAIDKHRLLLAVGVIPVKTVYLFNLTNDQAADAAMPTAAKTFVVAHVRHTPQHA